MLYRSLLFVGSLWLSFAFTQSMSLQEPPLFVSGYGIAHGSPDVVLINLGIGAQGRKLETVFAEVQSKVQAVQAVFLAAGVPAEAIHSEGLSVFPEQQGIAQPFSGNASGTTRFQVERVLSIRMRDIGEVDALLASSLGAGANRIYQVRYELEDTASLKEKAQKLAVADAMRNAERLADSLGVTLGKVVSIREMQQGLSALPIDPNSYVMSASIIPLMTSGYQSFLPTAPTQGTSSIAVSVHVGFEIE